MLPQSLWVRMYTVLKAFFLWCLISLLALPIILLLLWHSSLSPEGRIWWRHHILTVSRSPTLCIASRNGSLFSFTTGGRFCNDDWPRHWSMSITECIRDGFIVMFLYQTSSIWSAPRLMVVYLVSGCWQLGPGRTWVCSHRVEFKSNQTEVSYSLNFCSSITPSYLVVKSPL